MRKVILFIAMSLDGYIADNQGGIDWLNQSYDESEADHHYEILMESVDTVLLGNTTYQQIINELAVDNYPYHDKISYVFTHHNYPNLENIHFVNDNLCEFVKDLKKQDGRNIWIVGGASIINPLIKNNLIDCLELAIIPKLIGTGIPLFNQTDLKSFKLKSVEKVNNIAYINMELDNYES